MKDNNGCTTTVNVTITQPNAPLSASSSNQVNVLCYGNATGSFQVDVTGGTTGYTYQLDNGAFGNSNVFSGLTAGSYVVTVKDANGCTTTVSITITQPNAPLSATISNSVDVCFGYAVGSATVSPSGGTTPYTYSWNTVPAQTGATATGLAASSYIVTVTDSNGCTTTASVTINSNAIPNAGGDLNVCEETADLVDAAQDQSWSAVAGNPANGTVNAVTGAVSGMTAGGTYLFVLTSTFGCSDTVAVTTTSNCPIIANPDYVTTPEDSTVTINAPGNDVDPDGNIDNSSVTIIDQPNNGSVVINPDGTIIYTPNPNYNGTDTLIYQICDTGMPVYCDTALVVIVVTPVNDAPIANLDTTSTPEDTPVTVVVPGNDTDVDGNLDNSSVTIIDQPNNGTVVVNPDGSIIYTPNQDFNGVDSLIYQICDTGMPVLCDTAYVIINVTPVNDAPIANLDTTSTPEDTPVTIVVPGNDTDVDGNLDNGSVTIVEQPNNGSVTINPDGSIIYTPNQDFNGVDSLIYQICDTGMPVLCDTAYVIINVTPVNDAPIANQDNTTTPEDTPVTIVVPGNDTDVDGNLDNSSVTIIDQPNNGSVVINPDGSIIYTPNQDFNGVDSLIYQICDTGMPVLCDTAYVIINVTPVNDAPIANQDNTTTPEDTPVTIVVTGNDTDVDGNLDNSSVTIIDQPNNGSVVINPDGSIIYTPNQDFNGVDSLIYQICDTGIPVLCDTAYVIINVTPVNDAPIANLDTTSTPEDTPVTVVVPGNDTDVDGNLDNSSVTIVDQPNNGSVTINPDGSIIYTPNQDFNGVDSLIYQICDTGMPVLCDTAYVIINVTPVNDPPVALTDTASTLEDTPININIDFNDYDVDGNLDTNSVVIVIPPVNGSAIFDPTLGEIIYTPNNNFFGTDSLLYQICDSLGLCDTAWVYIVIESVPDITIDPNVFPSGNNISCFGANDGSIDLTIDLGTPPYTISWTGPNSFTSADEDISGLAPGTYNVTITDLNGNIAQGSVTLTEPTLLQGSGIVLSYNGGYNVSCGGITPACDGSIDYTVTGGSPAYSVSWTGPNGFTANTQDISGLCAGTYTIVVTDVNGCTVTNTYTLTAPPALDPIVSYANYNGYNVTCNGACNGSINLTVNGGVAPFTYAWVGPNNYSSTSEDINNLCAGNYTVVVTDANGCTSTINVTLTEPPVLAASLLAATYNGGVNISCSNACDGSINATITGGVAPFTYSWTGPNGFTSSLEDISALCAGTYVLNVTDANGCTTTQTITLTQPAPVSISLAAALYNGGYNVSCGGVIPACDGSINGTVTGGTAPYSYSWIGPNGFVAVTEDIGALCVGTYTLTVTDANGCIATQTVTLVAPPALEVGGVALEYLGGNNISCANACDGAIDLVINGGVAPFTISWVGPNGFASSTEDISNLCAGAYTVTVTDANGCSATQTITLTQPPVISVFLQAALYNGGVNISCANACDGSINATISGGTTPYSYSWVGPNGFVAVTDDLSNLCAGTYVLTVTDANNCTSTGTITLLAPDTLTATAVGATTNGGTNISCNGVCDGSINLTIAGGTAPYIISWVGPNGFVSATEDISSLCAGTYVATITDANNCSATATVTLSEPPPVNASGVESVYAGGFNVGCNGGNDGAIDITVTGGSGTYTFTWSGPNNYTASTEDVSDLVAGNYTVIIADVNGCSDTLSFNLTEPEVITTSATSSPSSCGQFNGSIDLTVAGGSGAFAYNWTGPNGFTANTQDLTGIIGGQYIVEVLDSNGCSVIDTVIVNVKPPVAATAVVTNSLCNSSCNGSIDLTVTTGESPYGFAWSGPNSFSSTSEDISALCQGTYTVVVTDADGCTFTDTFNITAPDAVALTVIANNAATCTASNGSITINPTGGHGGYSFSWTGPNGYTSTEQNPTGLASGAYTVSVTDSLGCSHDQTINVGSVSNLALAATAVNATCHGINNGSGCAQATGATAPISYLWSNGDTTQCVDSLAPGTYIVTIIDANGCTGSDTIVITEPEMLAIAGDVLVYPNGYNISVIDGTDGAIDITVSGGSGSYAYNWNVGNGSTTLEDQISLPADTYVVVVTDTNGCAVTAEYILEQPPVIELPTGFSPGNMDGMNDYYVIKGIDGLIDNRFTVFNRWGQVIYEKEGYTNDWAGTNKGGDMMPDGTYFVLFTVKVPNLGEQTFKATVELRKNFSK
ncbi:MAG: Ig-like domain-containing protein [Sphingobacteriales bacterium JAD_PAG50586_3]|nr:MAG: Ig-like domain-containing protein [Sphingobacteriales bacterium JAD_PAG50586_3]